MSKSSQEVELYGASPDELETLFERAATHYIDLYNETGKPPRMQEVASRVDESHPREYPSTDFILKRLEAKEFRQELDIRRRENLILTLGPKLHMAEMAVTIAREGLAERLARLKDPSRRSEISDRDLDATIKLASELLSKVDRDVEEVAQSAPVNKGTIVNMLMQVSPERGVIMLQELARQAQVKERQDA